MKKLIILIILMIAVAWGLQNYTDYKAIDWAKNYASKVKWEDVKNFKFPGLDFSKLKTAPADKQLNVFIRDMKFIPNMNGLAKGSKVTWFNEDTETHTVTGEGWGSPEIKPGNAWSKTFDVAGKYSYHCSLHPSMTGEIIIE